MSDIASQALRHYVDWDLPAERFGLVSVPKPVIRMLYEKLDENEAREAGRKYGEAMVEFVTFYYKKASFEKYLDLLDLLSTPSQTVYEHKSREKTNTVIMMIGCELRTYQSLGVAISIKINILW